MSKAEEGGLEVGKDRGRGGRNGDAQLQGHVGVSVVCEAVDIEDGGAVGVQGCRQRRKHARRDGGGGENVEYKFIAGGREGGERGRRTRMGDEGGVGEVDVEGVIMAEAAVLLGVVEGVLDDLLRTNGGEEGGGEEAVADDELAEVEKLGVGVCGEKAHDGGKGVGRLLAGDGKDNTVRVWGVGRRWFRHAVEVGKGWRRKR